MLLPSQQHPRHVDLSPDCVTCCPFSLYFILTSRPFFFPAFHCSPFPSTHSCTPFLCFPSPLYIFFSAPSPFQSFLALSFRSLLSHSFLKAFLVSLPSSTSFLKTFSLFLFSFTSPIILFYYFFIICFSASFLFFPHSISPSTSFFHPLLYSLSPLSFFLSF